MGYGVVSGEYGIVRGGILQWSIGDGGSAETYGPLTRREPRHRILVMRAEESNEN